MEREPFLADRRVHSFAVNDTLVVEDATDTGAPPGKVLKRDRAGAVS